MANALIGHSDNSPIGTDEGVIVDVETARSIRRAKVGSTTTLLQRVRSTFDLHPERHVADTAHTAETRRCLRSATCLRE